jgi:hypothetical protein
MIRLRLPKMPARASRQALPPELRWDAPPATAAVLLGRREFLKALGVVLAALSMPFVRAERAIARARGGFLTKPERTTLEALVDRIIPPDDGTPGGKALGAARYIEGLLTALDKKRTRLYAGGPFSGRNPFPDPKKGAPSRKRPRNSFKKFIPPTRLQELFWRGEIFGTAGIPELAAVDAQLGGPKKGLRDLYRESLAKVDEVATMTKGGTFASLGTTDQDAVLAMLDAGAFAHDPRRGGATFIDVLIRHTIEGCFSVPEYGGNTKTQGWAFIGLEGDSQPLGYSIFSETTGGYVERADHPMSTANPDELSGPKPLGTEGQTVQDTIVALTGPFSDGSLC